MKHRKKLIEKIKQKEKLIKLKKKSLVESKITKWF